MATPLDTMTIVLSGEVPLQDFAKAIANFDRLVKGLSSEVGGQNVNWVIQDLEISSALTTVRGIGERDRVERVVRAYTEVGEAIQKNVPISYSKQVQDAAHGLKRIINGKVNSIRFETAEREVIIRSLPFEPPLQAVRETAAKLSYVTSPTSSYGSLIGRVQTLTNRGALRFTLYDMLYDKAVSCYLKENDEEIMRGVWGKIAIVTGWITRDPFSGRPLSIREVDSIQPQPEETGDYRDARGAAPSLTNLSPEDAVRRLRDA